MAASPRSWPGSTMTASTWASTCSSQLTAASQYSGFSWSSRCWRIHFSLYTLFQPDRFWNADHERVYKMLFVVMFLLSAAAILAVELYHSLYYEGKSLSLKIKLNVSSYAGHVQSPIEYYLTGNRKEYFIRQTHLLLLWVFLGKSLEI